MQPQYTQLRANPVNMWSMSSTLQDEDSLEQAFRRAVAIMAQLRAPGGCPWDREQTFESIRRYTLEETYEVLDAIERQDWPALQDELGDLLLQVLFYAEMAREADYFNLRDVIETLNAKLVRRHPHVFANLDSLRDSAQVLANWEAIKKTERAERGETAANSILDAVPRNLPALMEASKLGNRAASVGFDWLTAAPVFEKLEEEVRELRVAIESGNQANQSEELGDILFTVVNLARKLQVQAELALRSTNAKFRRRFAVMESLAGERGLEELSADALERFWDQAKAREREDFNR